MSRPKPKRNKTHKPIALVIPRIVNEYPIMSSVYEVINAIRAKFGDDDQIVKRQGLADLNILFQQTTKVHEKAGKLDPSRNEILTAHNILARLNDDAEIKRSEFESVVNVLERVLAAVRNSVPVEIWHDVEMTMNIKQEIHGATEELWFGGALLPERRAA